MTPCDTRGGSTLWDSNESEKVFEPGESGAIAVLVMPSYRAM